MSKVLVAVSFVWSTLALAQMQQQDAKPSIVLVHGAFADGSSWAEVIPLLQAEGYTVVAVQNPLTSLADDVATTRRVIDDQAGKVVLVGHSWGGSVITQAGNHDKVSALVYVAAFAPQIGQSSSQTGKGFPPPPGLAHPVIGSGGYMTLSPEAIARDFAQDLPARQTQVMAATQGPIKAQCFEEKLTVAAWQSKPSWFVVAENDRMIAPEAQRVMAANIKATMTSVRSSHVPMLSRPKEVAGAILAAAKRTGISIAQPSGGPAKTPPTSAITK